MNFCFLVSREKKKGLFFCKSPSAFISFAKNLHLWSKAKSGVISLLPKQSFYMLGNTQKGILATPWISNLLTIFAKFMNAHVKFKIQGYLRQNMMLSFYENILSERGDDISGHSLRQIVHRNSLLTSFSLNFFVWERIFKLCSQFGGPAYNDQSP